MRRALLAALALAALAARASALDVPFLSGRVNDEARLLNADAAARLEGTLKAYEAKTGRQVVVLTIPSLEGEALEDYSLKVARTWKPGRRGKNDGVLLLVAKNDRKVRIETGYGLEGALPDALAGRIIRGEIVPRFRSGDFAGGIAAGVAAILKALDGEYSPPPEPLPSRGGSRARPIETIFMSVFVVSILGVFEWVGLVAPGAGWVLYFFLIPFWAAFPMALWGFRAGLAVLGAHIVGFPILKLLIPRTAWGKELAKRVHVRGNTVYFGGGGGSGWSSGGGGSLSDGGGGGFSGGGGSFGGGGSSGSW